MLSEVFGHALKKARESKGMTQKDLGKKVGVGWQRILAYEKGGDVSLNMASKLAQVLGSSLSVLVGTPVKAEIKQKNTLAEDLKHTVFEAVNQAVSLAKIDVSKFPTGFFGKLVELQVRSDLVKQVDAFVLEKVKQAKQGSELDEAKKFDAEVEAKEIKKNKSGTKGP